MFVREWKLGTKGRISPEGQQASVRARTPGVGARRTQTGSRLTNRFQQKGQREWQGLQGPPGC